MRLLSQGHRAAPSAASTASASDARIGAVCMVAIWAWAMVAGKDLGWDVLNHHLYLPFSWFSGRSASDLYAAGPQSYLNPIGYVPAYLLVAAGAPSWLLGSVLALGHALVVWPLLALTRQLWPDTALGENAGPRAMAVALALACPCFLVVAGTTSSDPWSMLLVLTGLAALLSADARRGPLVAAALVALAIAIKPTNVVFGTSLLALASMRCALGQCSRRTLLLALGVGVMTLLITAAPWAWTLWRDFGNPVYPLFNHVFRSPFAPLEPIAGSRYAIESATGLVGRAFEMASARPYVSTELATPDLRPAAAALLLALNAAMLGWRRAWPSIDWRAPRAQLIGFVLLNWLLWLWTSANARYALALFVLAGLLLPALAERVLPRRALLPLLGLLLAAQAAYFGIDGDRRMTSAPYATASPLLQVEVPAALRERPVLHLAVGTLSFAALALHLHPAGGFINVVGSLSLPHTGPLGERLRQRLHAWQGRTRVLFHGSLQMAAEPSLRLRTDALIYRFGLQTDWTDCLVIGLQDSAARVVQADLLSCAVLPLARRNPRFEADFATAERVFAALEARCPARLGPSPLATDADGQVFQRRYLNSEARVTVSINDGAVLTHFRSYQIAPLGSVDEILAGTSTDPCQAFNKLRTD